MYTLKSIGRRGSLLGAAAALVVAAVMPVSSVFADALNPLTHRSLTLSSSSPGWSYTDGSGNATYAPPNSGANGKQTGNTFAFNVSTDSSTSPTLKAMTFQYCTTSAGNCMSPGNDGFVGTAGAYTGRNPDSVSGHTSDLNIVASTPTELSTATGFVDPTTGNVTAIPNRDNSQGNFIVLWDDAGTWKQNSGWTMTATNKEDGTVAAGTATGKNNYITLTNTSGGLNPPAGAAVKVVFFGTDTNYLTNPGAGAFFVKINDYSDTSAATVVDGGVTVANVMNQSIEIQTKVLETMDFSVGTVDPNTLNDTQLAASPLAQSKHGECDPILPGMTTAASANTLQLGDTSAENSLSTTKTYSTHSYWRLSSNSSAGATVYYSGQTLTNTVGDKIKAIGKTPSVPLRGSPQFGLALANGTISDNGTAGPGVGPYTNGADGNYQVNYGTEENSTTGVFENGADNGVSGVDASVGTDISSQSLTDYHSPQLYPLLPATGYDQGAGVVNNDYGTVNTQFAFDAGSMQIPAALATESNQVVDCVTGKVRYIANIAATTPAGIYTTKVNYIAAPQY